MIFRVLVCIYIYVAIVFRMILFCWFFFRVTNEQNSKKLKLIVVGTQSGLDIYETDHKPEKMKRSIEKKTTTTVQQQHTQKRCFCIIK